MAATGICTEPTRQAAVVATYSARYAYYLNTILDIEGFTPDQIDTHPLHIALGRIMHDDIQILRLYHQSINSNGQDLFNLFVQEVTQSAPSSSKAAVEAGIRHHLYTFLANEERVQIKEFYDNQGFYPSDYIQRLHGLARVLIPEGTVPSDFIDQIDGYLTPEGVRIVKAIHDWEFSYYDQEAHQRLDQGLHLIARFANDLFQQYQAGYLQPAAIDNATRSITNFITRNGHFPLIDRIDRMLIQQIFHLNATDPTNPFDRLKADLLHYREHADSKIALLQYAEKIWYSTQIQATVSLPAPSAPPMEDEPPLTTSPPLTPPIEEEPVLIPSPVPSPDFVSAAPFTPSLIPAHEPISYCDIRYQGHFAGKDAQQIWDTLLDVQKRDVLRHVHLGRAIGTAELAAMTLFPPSKWDKVPFSGGSKIERMLKDYEKKPPTDYPWKLSTEFVEQSENILSLFYQGKEEYYPEFVKLHKTSEFYLFVYLQAKAAQVPMPVELPNWAELYWHAPHMLEHSIIALERYIHSLPTTH